MSAAVGRFALPLKTMCSRKWLVPASSFVSMRDPTPTYTKRETERVSGISPTRIRSPFGSVALRYSIGCERYQSVAVLAAEHHRHVHGVRSVDRPDPNATEGRIHDVRPVIDRRPRFIHELDVQGIDVVVPNLPRVLAVPTRPARGNVARICGAVSAVVIDVADSRFCRAVRSRRVRDADIHRERQQATAHTRCIHELEHVASGRA